MSQVFLRTSTILFGDPDYHGTAAVVVHIGSVSEETYDVSAKNVTISGTVDGFDINIDDSEYDTVSLTLQGLKTELDAISAGSLEGTVDIDEILESNGLTELTEGTYTAQVEWNLPEGVKEKAPVSVYVKVEKNN